MSRWSTQRHGDDHQDDAEPEPGPRPPANQTGRLCGRRHLRAGPLSVGDDARLVGRFEGRTFLIGGLLTDDALAGGTVAATQAAQADAHAKLLAFLASL